MSHLVFEVHSREREREIGNETCSGGQLTNPALDMVSLRSWRDKQVELSDKHLGTLHGLLGKVQKSGWPHRWKDSWEP